MKKILFLFITILFIHISAMEPLEQEKEATVEIVIGGQDVAIPLDEFGEYSGSLGTLSGSDLSLLESDLGEFFGETVEIKVQEQMKEKAEKKKELKKKTLSFVHSWMKRQDPHKTKRLRDLHE